MVWSLNNVVSMQSHHIEKNIFFIFIGKMVLKNHTKYSGHQIKSFNSSLRRLRAFPILTSMVLTDTFSFSAISA